MAHKSVFGFLFALLFIGVVVIIIVCFTAKYGKRDKEVTEPFWKTSVVFQVYPPSLYDAHPDGIGDITGIMSKADYLAELGVGAVWISPVYTSPMKDFGYDISDFTDINPIFGTMADFDELVSAFHQRGLKVIMDFVPNHTSDQHEWFQKSVAREDPYTDYYIWADSKGGTDNTTRQPPNNWT
ncbi:hypothetical protein OTU49_009515 [Cherax quadricarinatus]|uniref:Glycosyl hydrolase family 13 catalytic domain-containing protein n=1 Tax=Cherax quadricarinatus TaxID=27406 RepID=A0AAW0WPN6_CHEQU